MSIIKVVKFRVLEILVCISVSSSFVSALHVISSE